MKAYELPVRLTPEGNLELPDAVRNLLPAGRPARIIVLIPDPDDAGEQRAWEDMTREQFLAGYVAADAVYDRP